MSVAYFKVSVDRSLFETMHGLGRMDDVGKGIDFSDLNPDHIESWMRGIAEKAESKLINPTIIQDALRGVIMPRKISDPESCILQYLHDIFGRMEGV